MSQKKKSKLLKASTTATPAGMAKGRAYGGSYRMTGGGNGGKQGTKIGEAIEYLYTGDSLNSLTSSLPITSQFLLLLAPPRITWFVWRPGVISDQ